MEDKDKCGICGTRLSYRIEIDSVSGKKAIKDCPKCHPVAFGLSVPLPNRGDEMPV